MDKEQERRMEELYREMYGPLLSYAGAALRDKNLAEEAVQDCFRIACAKYRALSESENPQGWLMLTLKNVIRNMRRELAALSKLYVDAVSDEEENFWEKLADSDSERRMEDGQAELLYADLLEPEEFQLLKRIVLQRYTIGEAAQELGITLESCKKRIQRIKKKLRKKLEEDTPGMGRRR